MLNHVSSKNKTLLCITMVTSPHVASNSDLLSHTGLVVTYPSCHPISLIAVGLFSHHDPGRIHTSDSARGGYVSKDIVLS